MARKLQHIGMLRTMSRWVSIPITGSSTLHFFKNGTLKSVCGRQIIEQTGSKKTSYTIYSPGERNKKFYCIHCQRLIQENIDKKPKRGLSWVTAECSEPGCKEIGVFPTEDKENPKKDKHFCIKHNPLIAR